MKKVSASIVCFLMLAVSIMFVGCGDGFTEVYSVTANGTTYVPYIAVTYDHENKIEITESVWNELNVKYGYNSYSFSRDGSHDCNFSINDYVGYPQLTYDQGYYNYVYYKVKVIEIEKNIVSIKTEENKISIKTKDGVTEITSEDGKIVKEYDNNNQLTSIKTDFYTVTYFN